ncbi:MAG TPA: hypothetical protein VHE35_33700, partial [Kofleriaceae bacterium]|nr:hypothetical protein [Kofleriaceae bacterium]
VLVGGSIAAVVAATSGKKSGGGAAGSGSGSQLGSGSGSELGSGSGSELGSGSGTGTGGGSGSGNVLAIAGSGGGSGSGSATVKHTPTSGDDDDGDDDDGTDVVEEPPNGNGGNGGNGGTSGLDPAMAKKIAAYRSGVPECDEWLRTMAAMASCPAVRAAGAALDTSLEQMMTGFRDYRSLPQSARSSVVDTCKAGTKATLESLQQVGCNVKVAGPSDSSTEPTEPLPPVDRGKPYPVEIKGFSVDSWDYMAWFPTALAEARKLFPDAQVARIDAKGVSADGKVHLSMSDDFNVLYRFVSPSAAKRPADYPKGVKWEPLCMVQIIINKDDAMVLPMKGFGCEDPVPLPKCNARQIWARAIERGADAKNAYGELWYGYDNGKWSFEIEGGDDEKDFDVTILDGC